MSRDSLYRVSGSVERVVDVPEGTVSFAVNTTTHLPVVSTSSRRLDNSVRFAREDQSIIRDRFLLGIAKDTEVALGKSGNVILPPTTSMITLGVNHSFVAQTLSSSRHEQQVLNCQFSGTALLESDPTRILMTLTSSNSFTVLDNDTSATTIVTVSAGTYTTAQLALVINSRLASDVPNVVFTINATSYIATFSYGGGVSFNVTWGTGIELRNKLGFAADVVSEPSSASATAIFLTIHDALPAYGNVYYSKKSNLKTVTYKWMASAADGIPGFDALFGTIIASEDIGGTNIFSSPRTVKINVNETGKLKNIRVWVEVTHMSASGKKYQPLEDLGISLRSPNLRWGHAHPIKNSPAYKNWITSVPPSASMNIPFNFWRDSFVLWEGSAITTQISPTASDYQAYVRGRYPTFNRDRSMRVIFDDGSPIKNPRHLQGVSPAANTNGSPNGATALGNDYPWFSDIRISPAASGAFYGAAGSPPAGWLTGPGGTAATGEWATTGSNYGAETMRPVYPMLEPVFEKKFEVSTGETPQNSHGVDGGNGALWGDWSNWVGYRPGLRDTEISGSWEVLFAKAHSVDGTTDTMNTYVRQVRLELTYETGASPYKSKIARSKSRSDALSPRRNRSRAHEQISGSTFEPYWTSSGISWVWGEFTKAGVLSTPMQNYFKNEVLTTPPADASIGRTFGIVSTTSSLVNADFALFYRLSGTLGEKLGESPWWLVSNQFGMPMVPDSSSSLVSVTPSVAPEIQQSVEFFPRKTVDYSDMNSRDFVNRVNPPKKLAQIAREKSALKQTATKITTSSQGSYVYICKGTEGSDFRITLQTSFGSNKYEVNGSAPGLTVEFPNSAPGDRTSTDFRVLTSATVTAGDRIVFQITDLIREI